MIGGIITLVWDIWLQRKIGKLRTKWSRRNENTQRSAEEEISTQSIALEERSHGDQIQSVQRRGQSATSKDHISTEQAGPAPATEPSRGDEGDVAPVADTTTHGIPVKLGLTIIAAFLRKLIILPSPAYTNLLKCPSS